MAQKRKEATQETSPRQHEAEDVHARAWNRTEGRRQCSKSGEHCSPKLQNCYSPKFTNYSQIFITTQKSPKTKVVQNQSSTTLLLKPYPNSFYILKFKFEFKRGHFKELCLFNLLQILLNNFENSKHQLCTT